MKLFIFAPFSAYNYRWLLAAKILSCIGVVGVLVYWGAGTALVFVGNVYPPNDWIWKEYESMKDRGRLYYSHVPKAVFGLILFSGSVNVAFVEKLLLINDVQDV